MRPRQNVFRVIPGVTPGSIAGRVGILVGFLPGQRISSIPPHIIDAPCVPHNPFCLVTASRLLLAGGRGRPDYCVEGSRERGEVRVR